MSTSFRLWLLLCLACLPPLFAAAQAPLREKQVPQEVRDDFALRFDAAESVHWLKQGDAYYGARFQHHGRYVEVIYDQAGHWEQTDEEILFATLPDKARAFLAQAYAGYNAHSVHKVSTRREGIGYEVMVSGDGKHRFLTFDMHGELLGNKQMEIIEAKPDTVKSSPKLPALFKKSDGR
jgi:Putative beta-lactamase-inhibitor-like, PepSY-like